MNEYKTNGVNYATPESEKNTKRMLRKQFEKREEERKRLASGEYRDPDDFKKCSECGFFNNRGEKYCDNCGEDILWDGDW